jgi:hypothetical protein
VEFGELSTSDSYGSLDHHAPTRKQGRTYDVKTISLLDLLDKHGAPRDIYFISIEHDFTPLRNDIFSLLTAFGYIRKFEAASRFYDWYVRAS